MEVIIKYKAFFTMLAITLVSGYLSPVLTVVFISLSFLALKNKNQYGLMLAEFWFVLSLSDNRLSYYEGFVWGKYVCMALLGLFLIIDSKSFRPFNGFYKSFLPFLGVATICIFFSPPDVTLTSAAKTLSYLLLMVIVPNYLIKAYKDNGTVALKLLVFTGIFVLIAGLVYDVVYPYGANMEGRLKGMFGNPNALGIFCQIAFLFVTVTMNMYPLLFSRREKISIYIIILISLVLSGSRNSVIAVVLFLIFSSFSRISPLVGFVIMGVFLESYSYLNNHLIEIIDALGVQSFFRTDTLRAGSGRYIAWDFAWGEIQKNFLLGRGFDYTNYIFDVNQLWLEQLGHVGAAHNSYITFWLDTGLFGLILFLWAFIAKFFVSTKNNKLALAALYSILFSAFYESYLAASENPYLIAIFFMLTMFLNEQFRETKTQAVIPLH